MQGSKDRSSRERGQSACIACRRRKSRCKYEGVGQPCLMCRTHQTECVVPGRARSGEPRRRSAYAARHIAPAIPTEAPGQSNSQETSSNVNATPLPSPGFRVASGPGPGPASAAVSLDTNDEENPHVVAPATASDSHFLEDYLLRTNAGGSYRTIRPVLPGVTSTPVVFMRVKKRPVGLSMDPNPSSAKLQTIEKLLEPLQDALLNIYFIKGNGCFPILDETFLKEHGARNRISPAVMACLYAHSMCYWAYSPELSQHRRPDGRFIWNLALEALYSELHISPGMPSIIAILLNVGGRPTTTMVGNGMLLGCAISLAQGLGLNRNPKTWDIIEEEKTFRMRIWWCLVIQDRWTSLTYGTPPHIRQAHHDVPVPRAASSDERSKIFEALSSLTVILGTYLERLYFVSDTGSDGDLDLSSKLDAWTDKLSGDTRKVIVRGANLGVPGAANLRFCYLAARFYSCRLELAMDDSLPAQPADGRLIQARRMVEDIVLFIQELTATQLGDFWLPTAAIVLSSMTTFLVRVAVQMELPTCETATQCLSLSLAYELMASLRSHKALHGWELGDVCLTQYSDIVDKLWAQNGQTELDVALFDSGPFIPDPAFLGPMMIGQWEDPVTWCQGL